MRLKKDGEYDVEESCLSLIGGPRKCKRYKSIKVQHQNKQFQQRIKKFTGWTAQIIQHEIDHCNGVQIQESKLYGFKIYMAFSFCKKEIKNDF